MRQRDTARIEIGAHSASKRTRETGITKLIKKMIWKMLSRDWSLITAIWVRMTRTVVANMRTKKGSILSSL
eukprot:8550497-Karenia_brevis.AAC.1